MCKTKSRGIDIFKRVVKENFDKDFIFEDNPVAEEYRESLRYYNTDVIDNNYVG